MECRVNIFGDLCPQGISPGFRFPKELEREMEGAFNVVNLECPLTTVDTPRPLQAKNLKAGPEAMEMVSHFQAVSLANNHVLDWLDAGCEDTLRSLDAAGVAHFGLGRTYPEAIRPLTVRLANGVELAFVGASRYANASGGSWGTAPDNTGLLLRTVRQCRAEKRFTVVYLHAGYEYVPLPAPRERALARRCIRAGADLVCMAHPHVMQGVETFRGKTIAYSLGNFVFSKGIMNEVSSCPGDARLFRSFYLAIDIGPDHRYSVRCKGYRFDDVGLECFGDGENAGLSAELEAMSAPLHAPYLSYWRAYYRQAVAICRQNRKIRNRFQRIDSLPWKDRLRVLFSFNAQDFKNRVACLFPWVFR